jgi:hypothetical protein
MEPSLRPDLAKILPVPWPRTLAGRDQQLREGLALPAGTPDAPFLVDVERSHAPAAADAGFLLHAAQQVAARLAKVLAPRADATWPPEVHKPDAERVRTLLFED